MACFLTRRETYAFLLPSFFISRNLSFRQICLIGIFLNSSLVPGKGTAGAIAPAGTVLGTNGVWYGQLMQLSVAEFLCVVKNFKESIQASKLPENLL